MGESPIQPVPGPADVTFVPTKAEGPPSTESQSRLVMNTDLSTPFGKRNDNPHLKHNFSAKPVPTNLSEIVTSDPEPVPAPHKTGSMPSGSSTQ